MTQYEQCLLALKRLLDAVGENHWAQWIATDIEQWRSAGDTSHHLGAYGGMGSFNDVIVSSANKHSVTDETEAWANTLFEWLRALCYFLAKHPNDLFTTETLAERVGQHDSALAALVGGAQAPASVRGDTSESILLRGWRCLRCGQAEVTDRAIEHVMAQELVPSMVLSACDSNSLESLVDQVLALRISGIVETRKMLADAAAACGILVINRDGWNWRCPHCNSDDTAAYRWDLHVESGCKFEPSSDNLPLRQ